ncbi:MAG: transposase [Muribaculaceae bacterium]|nr:transposase [Muribaculaceae bacterium]
MKLQKISDITATLPFTEFDFLQKYRESFKVSELGRIHELLPLREIADEIRRRMPRNNPRGNKPVFPPEGEIALMFLKPYTGLSDDGLIEMLNGSLHMQMFCGVLIDPSNPIKDGKIVSAIRNRLAPYLDIRAVQKILYGKWSPKQAHKDMFLTDATCYESHLRYPTDIKLLWEGCQWMYDLLMEKSRMTGEPIEHRIVSIDRSYIRPIVRGKENKRVEFGAKVNCIQIDGISFIEHHSFEVFNEGVRLKSSVEYHKELTGLDAGPVGADTIYANNENRRYCTENNITTCFIRKGPTPRDEHTDLRTARRIIGSLRATVMERSFGNQKQHYNLMRIAARNRHSETLQLFFGIHMANAATLAARQIADEQRKKKRA